MSFEQKDWKDRIAEYINRRRITHEDGTSELITVERDEGTISQEGDAFNAENMNGLEERVAAGFEDVEDKIGIHNFTAGETILDFAVANKANRMLGFITSASIPSDSPTSEECFVIIEHDANGSRIVVRLVPYGPEHNWEYRRSIFNDAWREGAWTLKEYLPISGGTMSGNIQGNSGGAFAVDGNILMNTPEWKDWLSNILTHLSTNKATMGSHPYFYGINLGADNSVIPYIYTENDNIILRYKTSTGETYYKDLDHLVTTHMITVSGNEIILEWL